MEIDNSQLNDMGRSADTAVDELTLANALRILCIDQVQAAGSGHPGGPMGMADIATVLWHRHLNFNPCDPHWFNRDRVIFSNGHCSALQYALLHLCGYSLSLDDLKAFRQLYSKTPGHPEFGHTPGVEASTGPLAQGLCNGVGMALATRQLAESYNTPECKLIDHRIYVFVGDGCLMEGLSQEAISLAGHWGLGELIVIYDQNNVSIDGDISGWFGDNSADRARACNWHIIDAVDGHCTKAIDQAITTARAQTDKPTLILCRTRIGSGSPNKVGSADCHGAPLGVDEVAATRANLGWQIDSPFAVPDNILRAWDLRQVGQRKQNDWHQKWLNYRTKNPEQAQQLLDRFGLEFTESATHLNSQHQQRWQQRVSDAADSLRNHIDADASAATRQVAGKCLAELINDFPELIGGSADLSQSNCVINANSQTITSTDHRGNFLHYGAREFAMVAINNGLSLYGGYVPYSASFLVFTDYARNAIRMCALMKLRQVLVMTHDSIALGEDGPTHQPIEHLESLRLIPGLDLWRPGNTYETIVAWCESLRFQGPSLLALTRQKLPPCGRSDLSAESIARGGYVLSDCDDFAIILVATGSELALAVALASSLEGYRVRVVSMPNRQRFQAQDKPYRDSVLPPEHQRCIAIEAGCCGGWRDIIGDHGLFIGIENFGHSAPAADVAKACGMDLDSIKKKTLNYLNDSTD